MNLAKRHRGITILCNFSKWEKDIKAVFVEKEGIDYPSYFPIKKKKKLMQEK